MADVGGGRLRRSLGDRQRERTAVTRKKREAFGASVKYDPHSLLHHNHIASGASGHFRDTLRPSEIRAIEDVCGEWMAKWGYPPDRPPLTVAQRLLKCTYRRPA